MINKTKNTQETKKLGAGFANILKPGDVLLLYGELGAGKTTFVQGLAHGLGVKDRILSPTFVLQRNHKVDGENIKNINHIDLYRIDESTDIEVLGLSELIDEENSVTLIEWAGRLKNFKPNSGYKIYFEYIGETEREIKILKI